MKQPIRILGICLLMLAATCGKTPIPTFPS